MNIFGNPDRFAMGFELKPDPDSSGAASLRESWGALQIWVDGRNLTSGRAADGSSVSFAEVPLAPIVAWLAEHWDPLFHEGRLPRPTTCATAAAWRMDSLALAPMDDEELDAFLAEREAWWNRHALGSALPGFRIPDLHLRRVQDGIEISWDDREWRSVPGGVRLIEPPGALVLPAMEAAEVLHQWASAIVNELAAVPEVAALATELKDQLDANAHPVSVLERLGWAAGQRLQEAATELRRLAGVTTRAPRRPKHWPPGQRPFEAPLASAAPPAPSPASAAPPAPSLASGLAPFEPACPLARRPSEPACPLARRPSEPARPDTTAPSPWLLWGSRPRRLIMRQPRRTLDADSIRLWIITP